MSSRATRGCMRACVNELSVAQPKQMQFHVFHLIKQFTLNTWSYGEAKNICCVSTWLFFFFFPFAIRCNLPFALFSWYNHIPHNTVIFPEIFSVMNDEWGTTCDGCNYNNQGCGKIPRSVEDFWKKKTQGWSREIDCLSNRNERKQLNNKVAPSSNSKL